MDFANYLEQWKEVETKVKLLVLLVVVALFGLYLWFYYFEVSAKQEEITAQYAQIESLKSQIEELKMIEEKIPELNKSITDAKNLLSHYIGYIPSELKIDDVLRFFSRTGDDVGVSIQDFQPSKTADQSNSYYDVVRFNLQVKGTFASTMLFFDSVTRYSRIIHIKQLKIGSPRAYFAKYVVNSDVELETYIYSPKHSSSVESASQNIDSGGSE